MPRTLAQLRALEEATCAYMLAVEGLPYLWVTDHPGDALLGSGASSWIGRYESAAGWETVGERTVLPGLTVPSGLGGHLNPKTGLFESTGADFGIIDYDGTLASLFATEAAQIGKLNERIPPSQTALGASVIVDGAAEDLADYNIGIERLGPARERRFFFPFPIQGIGLHHQVNLDAGDDAVFTDQSPVPVPVTTSPIVFAGRLCTLWRLCRDDSLGESYLAWPSWDQYAATDWVWQGVMRDAGEYTGGRNWKIQCYGPESILRRNIGGNETDGWMQITSASTSLEEHERGIAINFRVERWGNAVGTESSGISYNATEHYNSAGFGVASSLADGLLPATGTITDFITAINDALQDVADGTNGDFGGGVTIVGDSVDNFVDDDHDGDNMVDNLKNSVRMEGTPTKIVIRRRDQSLADSASGAVGLVLCLHERVWRLLGFEPGLQDGEGSTELDDSRLAYSFTKLEPGDVFFHAAGDVNNTDSQQVPAEGYWSGWFTTARLNRPGDLYTGDPYGLDNDGAERTYDAFSSHTPVILSPGTSQTVTIATAFPYITPDPQIGTTMDAARLFVLRGKRAVGSVADGGQIFDSNGAAVDEVEAEDEYQVVQLEWNYSSAYGSVDSSSGSPTFTIADWKIPRQFGVDRPSLGGDWAAHADGEYKIEMRPLISWVYESAGLERAWAVLQQILLSTGSAGFQTAGLNGTTVDASTFFADDLSHSDWGLGIPHELVQLPADMQEAFAVSEPSGDPDGPLNQVRYVYGDGVQSVDVLSDLIRTRGLAMSMAGGRFGVVPMGQPDPADAEYALTEDDLYGGPDDPSAIHAMQRLRITGAIDRTKLAYRWNPALDSTAGERVVKARDINARTRRGDFLEEHTAHGLVPSEWKANEWDGEPDAWEPSWDVLWGKDRADFLAKRHFVWSAKLSRIQGQYLRPGTIVTVTDRTVINPAGADGPGADDDGYGITGAVGLVLKADLADPKEHAYDVEVMIFAGQFATALHVFAPIAKVVGPYTGGQNVTVEADHFGHGGDGDGLRFLAPDHATAGGDIVVCVLEYDRTTWTLHTGDTATVTSATGSSLTLDGAFSTTFHAWTDKWIVPANFGAQAADEWPRELLQPIVLADGSYAGGSGGGPDLIVP